MYQPQCRVAIQAHIQVFHRGCEQPCFYTALVRQVQHSKFKELLVKIFVMSCLRLQYDKPYM